MVWNHHFPYLGVSENAVYPKKMEKMRIAGAGHPGRTKRSRHGEVMVKLGLHVPQDSWNWNAHCTSMIIWKYGIHNMYIIVYIYDIIWHIKWYKISQDSCNHSWSSSIKYFVFGYIWLNDFQAVVSQVYENGGKESKFWHGAPLPLWEANVAIGILYTWRF